MRRSSLDVPFPPAAVAALVLVTACQHHRPATSAAARPARDSVQVGYGTQATRDVTGSISNVSGDITRQATITSLADMLEGRVPGLQVTRLGNGAVSVRIRGEHSFQSDVGEPLYVVDGIPMGGTGLPDIDPREVRSIQVLKDAGSLAAYGSRGANGVILINLKKPPKP